MTTFQTSIAGSVLPLRVVVVVQLRAAEVCRLFLNQAHLVAPCALVAILLLGVMAVLILEATP
jgi:hypothetical protein